MPCKVKHVRCSAVWFLPGKHGFHFSELNDSFYLDLQPCMSQVRISRVPFCTWASALCVHLPLMLFPGDPGKSQLWALLDPLGMDLKWWTPRFWLQEPCQCLFGLKESQFLSEAQSCRTFLLFSLPCSIASVRPPGGRMALGNPQGDLHTLNAHIFVSC